MSAPFLGDFIVGDTIDFKFSTTVDGLPTTLSGSPAISIYKANGTTESTAGVTLTADFDSRTGLNHCRITTVTDGTFYSAASEFHAVITTGTVGSVTQVGVLVASFSLSNRSTSAIKTKTDFLPSATAGAAGGVFIAGSNAATSITTALTANVIGNVTGALSGSVGSVTGAVGSVTGAVGSVTGAVGSVTGAVGSVTGAVGSVTAGVTLATNSVTAAALAADAVDEILDEAIGDGTTTFREALRILVAVAAGKLSGAGTTSITIRNLADSTNRVVATVDSDGNRSALTIVP